MSLTRRQRNIVDQILQEQLGAITQARRESEKLLDQSLLNEEYELDEAGPDAGRVDTDIMGQAMGEAVTDLGMDMADNLVYRFRNKVLPRIADAMNQHGMADVRINPRTIASELEDYDPDKFGEVTDNCVSDIAEVLKKYSDTLGQMAISAIGDSKDGSLE